MVKDYAAGACKACVSPVCFHPSMDLFAPRHLLIILIVCLVVFGTQKLKTLGSDLGSAVRGFKKAMTEGEADQTATTSSSEVTKAPSGAP